jgi:hypothetical protein
VAQTAPDITTRFVRIREARELLRQKAAEILDLYMKNALSAHEAGEYETASKSLQWLIEHMPKDEETGQTVVDTSIDKVSRDGRKGGDRIQILLAPTAPLPPRLAAHTVEGELREADDADTD